GGQRWDDVRARVTALLTDDRARGVVAANLLPLSEVTLHAPFTVGDYVDFYASEHHARTMGKILRGSDELAPNWKHVPIGYHGRSGTVVVSGTTVRRPRGQPLVGTEPAFGPSRRLDMEADVGYVVGTGTFIGQPVPV